MGAVKCISLFVNLVIATDKKNRYMMVGNIFTNLATAANKKRLYIMGKVYL